MADVPHTEAQGLGRSRGRARDGSVARCHIRLAPGRRAAVGGYGGLDPPPEEQRAEEDVRPLGGPRGRGRLLLLPRSCTPRARSGLLTGLGGDLVLVGGYSQNMLQRLDALLSNSLARMDRGRRPRCGVRYTGLNRDTHQGHHVHNQPNVLLSRPHHEVKSHICPLVRPDGSQG